VTKMLLSKNEFADAVGISVRTADNLIACKEVSVRRIGRRVLIPISEVEKFAKRDHATRVQPKVGPFDARAWRDDKTKLERKGNDNAGESPSIQPQS
jgi:excisionase family DNA binding protein